MHSLSLVHALTLCLNPASVAVLGLAEGQEGAEAGLNSLLGVRDDGLAS